MSVFIEEKKRRGKRGHRDNRTLRVRNPSIIPPTKHKDNFIAGADD
jgi:hypothetical protein